MSTAERRVATCRTSGGFTMIEMLVVMAMVSVMAVVVDRTIASTRESELQLSAVHRAVERGELVVFEVLEEVASSRKLFGDDALGQGYLAALDLSRDPLLPSARLPLFDESGVLGPDAPGDPRTGNILCFVRESDAAPAVANPSTGAVRAIDVYRFVCVYPHETTRTLVVLPTRLPSRDLVVWRSEPFPNHSQLVAIADPVERVNVVSDLHGRFGMDLAWDPNQPVGSAFFALSAAGTVATTPSTLVTIEEDAGVSDRGRLVYADVQLARTDGASFHRRAIFTKDNPGVWAPDGFEVKVAGASGSRKLWIHLVVEASARGGVVIPQSASVIASPKDL